MHPQPFRYWPLMMMAAVLLAWAQPVAGQAAPGQVDLLADAQAWRSRENVRRNNDIQRIKPSFGERGGVILDYPHRRWKVTWGAMVYQQPLALRGGGVYVDAQFLDVHHDSAYAGLRIGGVTTPDQSDGQALELRILPDEKKVICGDMEQAYRPRPEQPRRVEMSLHFEADRLRLVYGRQTLIDTPIRYVRPSTQTLTLVMNQSRLRLDRLMASTTEVGAPAIDFDTVELSPGFRALRSPFLAYFGTHYSGSEGLGKRFSAVRGFGGTHVGLKRPPQGVDVPMRTGPFSGQPVRVRLEDFHSQSRFARNPKAGPELFRELTDTGLTAIYTLPTGPVYIDQPYDRDFAYWFYRLAHEQYPTLNQHAVWQIGNEIVSQHWNPRRLDRSSIDPWWNADRTRWHGYDLEWKLDFYINHWLGPAIEAIRVASRDVYGDPRAIPVATGSMNPYNAGNIWFLEHLMDARFDGERVPTLAGDAVWQHVDYLTVHYMIKPPWHKDYQRLNQYVQDYLKTDRIKALWVTEEHGGRGAGASTVIERAMYMLRWAAENNLDGDQTKVFWYGEKTRSGRGSGEHVMTKLGTFLKDRKIDISAVDQDNAFYHVIAGRDEAGDVDRLLVVVLPQRGSEVKLGTLALNVPEFVGSWQAQAVDYSYLIEPPVFPVQVTSHGRGLKIECNRVLLNPTAIYLTKE